MADPFATAGELAQHLGLPEPADLARFQQHLHTASALARSYTGQELSEHAGDVIILQPTYSDRLFLPETPVTAVTTVEEAGVPFTEFGFTPAGLLFRNDGLWDEITEVTYDHGFAEFSPDYEEIKRVVLEVAGRSITHNRDGTADAMGGTVMDSAGYSPEVFLTPQERWQLGGYSLAAVG